MYLLVNLKNQGTLFPNHLPVVAAYGLGAGIATTNDWLVVMCAKHIFDKKLSSARQIASIHK